MVSQLVLRQVRRDSFHEYELIAANSVGTTRVTVHLTQSKQAYPQSLGLGGPVCIINGSHSFIHPSIHSSIHSFIHSGYFYSASSSTLILRGAPGTARILCRSFTPKHHRQLRVKDLPKVPTWRLEWNSNTRPFGQKETNLPMSHQTPHIPYFI